MLGMQIFSRSRSVDRGFNPPARAGAHGSLPHGGGRRYFRSRLVRQDRSTGSESGTDDQRREVREGRQYLPRDDRPGGYVLNPANTASGNYTVTATFDEPKYMNLNDHPHPYGIMIAGNGLGTDNQSYLYCAAWGSAFIVRPDSAPRRLT